MIRVLILSTIILGAYCVEEPSIEEISRAICQIETGTTWDSRVKVRVGKAGEKGKWQITPEMLRTVGGTAGNLNDFILTYTWFRSRTKTWQEACAAYHRGLNGIHKKAAKDYAQRVANLIGVQ